MRQISTRCTLFNTRVRLIVNIATIMSGPIVGNVKHFSCKIITHTFGLQTTSGRQVRTILIRLFHPVRLVSININLLIQRLHMQMSSRMILVLMNINQMNSRHTIAMNRMYNTFRNIPITTVTRAITNGSLLIRNKRSRQTQFILAQVQNRGTVSRRKNSKPIVTRTNSLVINMGRMRLTIVTVSRLKISNGNIRRLHFLFRQTRQVLTRNRARSFHININLLNQRVQRMRIGSTISRGRQ